MVVAEKPIAVGMSGVEIMRRLGCNCRGEEEKMIAVRLEKTSSRQRDIKQRRLVLDIGPYHFHMSREEALRLKRQLEKFELEPKKEG
jgi:hypothetical protein